VHYFSNRSPNSSQRVVSLLNLCQIANALTDTGLVPRSRLVESDLVSWPGFWVDDGLSGSYASKQTFNGTGPEVGFWEISHGPSTSSYRCLAEVSGSREIEHPFR
jgi:hypothetical protein